MRFALSVLLMAVLLPVGIMADEFPLRPKYPDLTFISIDDFGKIAGESVVVDVRSQFEYETLHIEGAHNISYTNTAFASQLAKIRKEKDVSKKIVFYCNGHSCDQSYEAGKMAKAAGFDNFVVFDAGVKTWATKHPDKSVFFGEKLGDAGKLLSGDIYKKHAKNWAEFQAANGQANVLFIDVREPFARKKVPDLKGLRSIPLSRISQMIRDKKFQDQILYFLDGSGKQLPWLQYHLERSGYKNYFLLEEGLNKVLN